MALSCHGQQNRTVTSYIQHMKQPKHFMDVHKSIHSECFKSLNLKLCIVLNYVVSDPRAEFVFNINLLMWGTFSELGRSILWINPSGDAPRSSQSLPKRIWNSVTAASCPDLIPDITMCRLTEEYQQTQLST